MTKHCRLNVCLLCRLKAMYYDRKRDFIVKGEWFDHPKQ
jgi:hypothetical protein